MLAGLDLGTPLFYLLALLTVGSAVQVVLQKSPLYSALALIVTLVSMALLFIQLNAPFLATIQVLVYAGAIMVLFVFIIMLLNLGDGGGRELVGTPAKVVGILLLGMLFLAISTALDASLRPIEWRPVPDGFGTIEAVGDTLFRKYVLAFELAGVLLLAAILGAITLARRKP